MADISKAETKYIYIYKNQVQGENVKRNEICTRESEPSLQLWLGILQRGDKRAPKVERRVEYRTETEAVNESVRDGAIKKKKKQKLQLDPHLSSYLGWLIEMSYSEQ